jgi:copper chaperone CopZ
MTEVTFSITGMSCGDCAARVEKALLALKGVQTASCNSVLAQAAIMFDSAAVGPDVLKGTIEQFGFSATEVRDDETGRTTTIRRIQIIRVAIVFGLLCTAWIM